VARSVSGDVDDDVSWKWSVAEEGNRKGMGLQNRSSARAGRGRDDTKLQ
jgi:hypothetical protein